LHTFPTRRSSDLASMSFLLSTLLLITVTECPFAINAIASGLLMLPKEPVTTIFIFLLLCLYKDAAPLRNRCIQNGCYCSLNEISFEQSNCLGWRIGFTCSLFQLNDCRNLKGESFVFALKNLLND